MNSCHCDFVSRRAPSRLFCRREHIFNKYSVAHGRIVYHNMRHRAYYLAVLNDGRATHECVQ